MVNTPIKFLLMDLVNNHLGMSFFSEPEIQFFFLDYLFKCTIEMQFYLKSQEKKPVETVNCLVKVRISEDYFPKEYLTKFKDI